MEQFSKKRLLGDRVPYVVEAYPEGNMAHLSAESALHCRVFTEGLFGIVPKGLNQFNLTPRLPRGWNDMALRNIKAFNQDFDIHILREGSHLRINVENRDGQTILNTLITDGDTVVVNF